MLATLAHAAADRYAPRLRAEIRRHPRPGRILPGTSGPQFASGPALATTRPRSSPRSSGRSSGGGGPASAPDSSTARLSPSTSRAAAGFQRLQGRIHLKERADVARGDHAQPVALILFDLLRDGDDDVRGLPLVERRTRLEAHPAADVRHDSPERTGRGDGTALHARAKAEGWEGLIVKDALSPYHSGRRSPAWRKLKSLHEQEFVVGGWTEPRQTLQHFGALLLGVYEGDGRPPTADGRLVYVGHTGTGFDGGADARLEPAEAARDRGISFLDAPSSPMNVRTGCGRSWSRRCDSRSGPTTGSCGIPSTSGCARTRIRSRSSARTLHTLQRHEERHHSEDAADDRANGPEAISPVRTAGRKTPADHGSASVTQVIDQLRALEDARKDGAIELPDGERLGVTNLRRCSGRSEADQGRSAPLLRQVAPLLLPAVADRPLVMKRFPNGVDGPAFYQQREREEQPPPGVRIEPLARDSSRSPSRTPAGFIGGSLITLLYMTQIAAISQDPWFSRVQSPLDADYVALDLDPDDDAPFARVLEVARWVRDELRR